MKYFISLITPILVIAGNLFGGIWVWMNVITVLIVFVILDWMVKPSAEENTESEFVPNLVLYLHVLMHTLAIGTLLLGAYNHTLVGWTLFGSIFSTGLNSGISGIISAHELIHRKQKSMQSLGIWNLFLVHYTHFYIEHIVNHHKHVGTMNDPATARFGESLYAFIFRTIPAQFFSAFHIAGEQKKWYNNFVILGVAFQLLFDIMLYYFFGKEVLFAFVLQSFIAIILLEYVNYIEHYGLVRNDGIKVDATHSWQSNALTSRLTLLELSRHSDHHLKASKPYHTLVSHTGSPEMPSGYFGMFYTCLIPGLWYKTIHPLIMR